MIHYLIKTDQYALALRYPFRDEVVELTVSDVMDRGDDLPDERKIVFMAMAVKNPKTNHRPLVYSGKNAPKSDVYHRLLLCR